MKRSFLIRNLKICSINNAYATKDRKKSTDTVKWLFDLQVQMLKNKAAVNDLKNFFMRTRHFLTVEYDWFVPEKEFFRKGKGGGLNSRAGDWSNFAKLPDDRIFNEVLGIDDGLIAKGTVFRLPWQGVTHNILIEIQILENDQLYRKTLQVLPEALK